MSHEGHQLNECPLERNISDIAAIANVAEAYQIKKIKKF